METKADQELVARLREVGHVTHVEETTDKALGAEILDVADRLAVHLASLQVTLDGLQGEISAIDGVLGNRSAFDGFTTRTDKIAHAIKVSSQIDPKATLSDAEREIRDLKAHVVKVQEFVDRGKNALRLLVDAVSAADAADHMLDERIVAAKTALALGLQALEG